MLQFADTRGRGYPGHRWDSNKQIMFMQEGTDTSGSIACADGFEMLNDFFYSTVSGVLGYLKPRVRSVCGHDEPVELDLMARMSLAERRSTN